MAATAQSFGISLGVYAAFLCLMVRACCWQPEPATLSQLTAGLRAGFHLQPAEDAELLCQVGACAWVAPPTGTARVPTARPRAGSSAPSGT